VSNWRSADLSQVLFGSFAFICGKKEEIEKGDEDIEKGDIE